MRPSNKDKKIKGLCAVGGGVHPGGGTPIVIMSSGIVTQEMKGTMYNYLQDKYNIDRLKLGTAIYFSFYHTNYGYSQN